ncbi:MAG: hypothetical protein V2I26_03470 [Halieaceae bacterium]|nr:hypothetical protein [Halieaceae bacterium]
MTEIVVTAAELIPRESEGNPFASVAIHCGINGCAAAREIAGKRHLLEEAPALPLARCAAKTCNCRYFRYGDRRSLLSNRRTHGPAGGRDKHWFWQKNRRSGQERRKLKIDFRRWI